MGMMARSQQGIAKPSRRVDSRQGEGRSKLIFSHTLHNRLKTKSLQVGLAQLTEDARLTGSSFQGTAVDRRQDIARGGAKNLYTLPVRVASKGLSSRRGDFGLKFCPSKNGWASAALVLREALVAKLRAGRATATGWEVGRAGRNRRRQLLQNSP